MSVNHQVPPGISRFCANSAQIRSVLSVIDLPPAGQVPPDRLPGNSRFGVAHRSPRPHGRASIIARLRARSMDARTPLFDRPGASEGAEQANTSLLFIIVPRRTLAINDIKAHEDLRGKARLQRGKKGTL